MKKVLFTMVLCLGLLAMQAQSIERSVISSMGGSYYDGVSFEMDYTVGEVMVATISNSSNFLTQGFQQPYSNATVAVQEISLEDQFIMYFPNPVNDQLAIMVQQAKSGEYRYQVYDLLGKLLAEKAIEQRIEGDLQIDVDFSGFSTGNYFLRVMHDGRLINCGKIIKINQ